MLPSADELIRSALGPDYAAERELTGGGIARVVVARDQTLGRRVVVKVIAPGIVAPDDVERFRREIRLAVELQHPHIVPILSAGRAGDQPYLVMPWIEGGSLRDRLLAGPLGPVEAVRVLRGVALALACAHARGIVHRDVKPDNVLLASGVAMVADFGIAKALAPVIAKGTRVGATGDGHSLTIAGTSLGTPTYMAPEQIAADPAVDHRADIYAFGVMAYELLAGRPPFTGDSLQQLFAAHLASTPPSLREIRPELPEPLATLVMRCLEKDPADRPQSADALVAALERPEVVSGGFATASAAGAAGMAMPWTTGETAPARGESIRRLRRLAGAALVLLAAVALVLALRARRPTAAAIIASPAVAVLPFPYIGPDSADAFLADGVVDAMASALAGRPGIRALSRTRSAALQRRLARGDSVPAAEAGAYFEGAVQEGDEGVTVALRLVRATDGVMLWGGLVEVPQDSVGELYARVSTAVGEALARLAADSVTRPATP